MDPSKHKPGLVVHSFGWPMVRVAVHCCLATVAMVTSITGL